MNLGTIVEGVFIETNRRSPKDRIHALRGIEKAMRKVRRERFWFNTFSDTFTAEGETTPRERVVGLDAGGEIIQDPWDEVTVHPGGNENRGYPAAMLRVVTMRCPGRPKPYRGVSLSKFKYDRLTSGRDVATIEGPNLLLSPAVSGSVEATFVKDLGTVVVSFEEGTGIPRLIDYTRLNNMSVATLGDEYTNDWFVEAPDLIIFEAAYSLYMGIYSNTAKAQRVMRRAEDVRLTLSKLNSPFQETAPRQAYR